MTEHLVVGLDVEEAPADVTSHHAGMSPSSRRALILAPAAAALAAVACVPTPAPPPSPPQGAAQPPPPPPGPTGPPWSAEMVVDKLTFGARPGLVNQVAAMGVWAWIDQQLAPGGVADAESRVAGAQFQSLRNSNLANFGIRETDGGEELLFDQLDHATIIRAVHSERQLYEVMCDFWSNHFCTWRRQTWMGFMKTRDHEDVVRAHALGKFRDMLSASAHSPAMLDYLDNIRSDASRPGGVNQNYARELLELHTLGIIEGNHVYSEADVQAVAQIISGWSLDWDNGATKYDFEFAPWQHDRRAVSCFGGAVAFPARAYGQGLDDGVVLLNYLSAHPSTAKFIAWKLCRRFVGDNPPMSLVDSTAAVFSANDTAIAPTLRHIFSSAEFGASKGSKIRRPLEHLVACLRGMNATFGTDPQGNSANALRGALEEMGQPLFERVTPDGYPDIAPLWVSSDSLINRWEVAGKIARNRLGDTSTADKVAVDLAALMPNPLPATVADLVWWIGSALANISIPANDVTDLCTAIGAVPGAAASTLSTNTTRLPLAVGLVFSHPLFQRR